MSFSTLGVMASLRAPLVNTISWIGISPFNPAKAGSLTNPNKIAWLPPSGGSLARWPLLIQLIQSHETF